MHKDLLNTNKTGIAETLIPEQVQILRTESQPIRVACTGGKKKSFS